jgi:precorrin-2 dehydrogenase/sirohydrochlorin ferrochelatase
MVPLMHVYPVFLSLAGSRVLVAGAGRVGGRKVAGLRDARAGEILVFDPALSEEERRDLQAMPGVRVFCRTVQEGDIAGCVLVFAATGDSAENGRIAALCAARNILCNVADDPEGGTFHVPAHVRVEGLTAAFSTGVRSPSMSGRIRRDATVWLKRNYGPLLVFMGRLRPLVLSADNEAEKHGELFRSLVDSGLGEALASKDARKMRETAAALLPASLHGHIEELLHGLG